MPRDDDDPTVLGMILRRLDGQDRTLEEIRRHTSATNGRVTSLELWKARTEGVRAAYSWLVPVIASVVGAIIGSGLLLLLSHG